MPTRIRALLLPSPTLPFPTLVMRVWCFASSFLVSISSLSPSNFVGSVAARPKLIAELQKNPVDGFSAGLVDDENMLEWQIVIMG